MVNTFAAIATWPFQNILYSFYLNSGSLLCTLWPNHDIILCAFIAPPNEVRHGTLCVLAKSRSVIAHFHRNCDWVLPVR